MPSWDSVTISDGTTTNKYCGTTIPTSISSSTGSLSVNFIADQHTGAAGFEFDYACNSIGTTTPTTTTTTSSGGNFISRLSLFKRETIQGQKLFRKKFKEGKYSW